MTGYVASKAGVIGLTKSIAKEFAAHDITVNCIAPGGVKTQMLYSIPQPVSQI